MAKHSPIDWTRVREAKRIELESLRALPIAEATPSRRDFSRFIGAGRRAMGVVPVIRRRDPYGGREWAPDAGAFALALDELEVAAIAVTTEPVHHGGRLEDLRAAAERVTAPVLRDDYLLDPLQVYQSRMHGADACVVPVAWVNDDALERLARTASSLHMTLVLGLFDAADAARALPFERTMVGVLGSPGAPDFELLAQIGEVMPPRRAIIRLGDVDEPADFARLHGSVDAALVARAFMDAGDPAEVLAELGDG